MNVYLLLSYIIVDSFCKPCFWEFKKNVERSHVRVSLLEEWKVRYPGALRAEKSLHFGAPHKCSFCVVARCSIDKKKKKWKLWAEKRMMTGDAIYCMGGWADLVHEDQFIHSNKWGSIWTLMSTGKLIWCWVFWELFFSDYFCFLNEMEVMSSTKSKYQGGHGRCLIREDKMWTHWDRVRKNRGGLEK